MKPGGLSFFENDVQENSFVFKTYGNLIEIKLELKVEQLENKTCSLNLVN